jgi:hypothetical protein
MGLDMTAYAFRNGERFTATRTEEQFHYWRKHHALLEWCSTLAVTRGEAAWDEPIRSIQLAEKDLDRLEAAVRNGELPDFFEDDEEGEAWQPYDLTFIAKARALISAGFQVEIDASW